MPAHQQESSADQAAGLGLHAGRLAADGGC